MSVEWPILSDGCEVTAVSDSVITDPAVLRALLGDDLCDLAEQSPRRLKRTTEQEQ